MKTIRSFEQQRVGDIAASLPGATAVFRSFGVDFCSCGDRLLTEECIIQGLDSGAVVHALELLRPKLPNAPLEPAALIDYILAHYHAAYRVKLPELIRLANKVERVHSKHPDVPKGLTSLLKTLHVELEKHMQEEESALFLILQSGDVTNTGHQIAQMRYEHRQHGQLLHQLEQLAQGFQLPPNACASWKALYVGIQKLSVGLMEHIHLENNVLFPHFISNRDSH